MKFKGVVITDAIGMRGVNTLYPPERLYVELLKAGNDVILGPVRLDYIDAVEKAALSSEIPEERINDACRRVLKLKEKLGLLNPGQRPDMELTDEITAKTKEMNREVAEKCVTLVSDKNSRLPFRRTEVKNVAIICSAHANDILEMVQPMKRAFENRGATVTLQRRLRSVDECGKIADGNDLIIYAAFIGMHEPLGGAAFFGEEASTFLYAFSKGKEKSIGISIGSPFVYYDYFTNIDMFINAYWNNEEIQEAAVASIYGEIPFKGKSPFKLTLG